MARQLSPTGGCPPPAPGAAGFARAPLPIHLPRLLASASKGERVCRQPALVRCIGRFLVESRQLGHLSSSSPGAYYAAHSTLLEVQVDYECFHTVVSACYRGAERYADIAEDIEANYLQDRGDSDEERVRLRLDAHYQDAFQRELVKRLAQYGIRHEEGA